jgi:GT2 family glycosyltransferase
LYLPSAKAVHLNRGWSARRTERQPRYYYKSRTRYFRKFYGWGGWLLANLAWTAGRAISKLRELLGGRAAVIPAAAWRDIWTVRCGTKLIQR